MPQHESQRHARGMCPPAALLTLAVCAGLLGALAWYLPGIARGLPRAVVRLATVGVPEEFPHASVRAMMGGLLVLIAQFGLGYLLLARVPAWRRSLPRVGERAALAPLVGLLPLGLGVLAMGLTGYASPVWLTLALIVVLIALGLPGLREFNRDADPSLRPTRVRRRWREQPALLVTAILLGVLTLLYALAPPSESDELRYHLAAPATWLRLGGIHYLPWQAFSCFPFLAEMLFMAAMAAGGPAAAKVVHFAQLPLGAGLVALWTFELGRFAARDTRRTAKLAALGYATIPMALVLSAWGFIDLFVVNIYLGFGYVALRGLRAPRRAAPTLLGWMGAGALGLKYTMGPLMLAGGALWLVLRLVRRGGRPWRDAAACALVAAVLGSPFYVKNYRDTGNPVYPLAWGVFGGGEWSAENDALYLQRAGSKGMPHGGDPGIAARVGELLATPVLTTFRFDWYENHLVGPVPLLSVVLVAGWLAVGMPGWPGRGVARGRRGLARLATLWTGGWLALNWLLWFLTYQSNRFLLPSLALAIAAAGTVAAVWPARAGRVVRRAGAIVAAAALAYAATTDLWMLGEPQAGKGSRPHAIATAIGAYPAEAYLAERLNYYRAAQWIGDNAGEFEGALLIGEHRTLYWQRPTLASDWFDTPQPVPLMRVTKDNDELLDRLLKQRYPYVVLNWGELSKYIDVFMARMTEPQRERFRQLIEHERLEVVRRFQGPDEDVVIYRIRPRPAGSGG